MHLAGVFTYGQISGCEVTLEKIEMIEFEGRMGNLTPFHFLRNNIIKIRPFFVQRARRLVVVPIDFLVSGMKRFLQNNGRPMVTLSYAQSLDGSIAICRGKSCALSGSESQLLTHQLRAAHDSILVGIGTIIADNPRLTVRLVEGADPVPVILDSQLRFPLNSNLIKNRVSPVIATTFPASPQRQEVLEEAGAQVIRVAADDRGWVDLHALLKALAEREISSVMVEGGARVITSFLSQRLVDRIVITITPKLLGGLHAVENPLSLLDNNGSEQQGLPEFRCFGYEQVGSDLVFWSALN